MGVRNSKSTHDCLKGKALNFYAHILKNRETNRYSVAPIQGTPLDKPQRISSQSHAGLTAELECQLSDASMNASPGETYRSLSLAAQAKEVGLADGGNFHLPLIC